MLIWPKKIFVTKFEDGYQNNSEFYADFESVEKNIRVFFGNSRMQIRKKWLNQLKNFFNKHCKQYYLASFCWWIPSSCENHCNLVLILATQVTEVSEIIVAFMLFRDVSGLTRSSWPRKSVKELWHSALRILIRIHQIHMFLGLPDPDPLDRSMDPDPNPSIIMQK